jgi:hypothetical protein
MDLGVVARLLRDIQLKGRLDYEFACHTLSDVLNAKAAYFFQILTERFSCKYSSDGTFVVGDLYGLDDLPDPEHQFLLYQGPDLIAILSVGHISESLPDRVVSDMLHNVLALGVIMTRNQDAVHELQLSVCAELGQLLSSVLQLVDSTPPLALKKVGVTKDTLDAVRDYNALIQRNLSGLGRTVTQALALVLDVRDYLQLNQPRDLSSEEDFVMRDLLQEVVDTYQEPGQRTINAAVSDSVPRVVRCSRAKLKQVLDTVMQKLSDSGSVNISVESQPSTAQGFMLILRLRTAVKVDSWFSYESVDSKTLTTALLKRLCLLLRGEITMDDDGLGLQIRVRCEASNLATTFLGKQVLICIIDPAHQGPLFSLFSELGSVPTMSGPDPSLYLNHIERFQLVVCDGSFRQHVPKIRKRNVPVLGILGSSPQDRSLQFTNFFSATSKTPPLNVEEVSLKARSLLE